jgi:hypothetical protein
MAPLRSFDNLPIVEMRQYSEKGGVPPSFGQARYTESG